MKRMVFAVLLTLAGALCSAAVFAVEEQSTIYLIKKGDTLWGLSQRFLQDPNYWPNLWANNQSITNPHLIVPGQRVRVYPNRIEMVESSAGKAAPAVSTAVQAPAVTKPLPIEEVAKETAFTLSGSEGFLLEKDLNPAGYIISTYQNREIVGEDDIVYTDIGKGRGAKPGDRFDIYKKTVAISHPVTNIILGHKVIPLGTLQLTEVEASVSKAIITKSYLEVSAGSFVMPYRERRREVVLKAATKELSGYIVETQTGNKAIAAGDIAFLDIGRKQGAEAGNMLYVVRDVELDQKFISEPIGKLPEELIGALVIVETAENSSTALVVKSIDTIYRGDRVSLQRNK